MKKFIFSILFFTTFLFSNPGYSFECKYLEKDNGEKSDRVVKCEGETMYLFPKNKAEKMLKDLKNIPTLKEEISLKDNKIRLLEKRLSIKDDQIKVLKLNLERQNSLNEKLIDSGFGKISFFEKPGVNFVLGFLTSTITYAVWQGTDK